MDSKNIFIAAQATLRRVEWRRPAPDSEWAVIADGADVDLAVVQRHVDDFFLSSELYLVTDRHASKGVARSSAGLEIKNALRKNDVVLCDTQFKNFMVFSALGTVKQGTTL